MTWKPRPNIDFEDQPEFRWPYRRVGLDEDELFGSLDDQFDERIPLLDPVTFHHEIQDIASHAHDKDDFLCQAKDRVNRHAQTIDDMLYGLFITIMEGRSSLSQTQQYKFVHFHQYRSLNSIAVFLSSVVDPNHREDQSFCSECWCLLQAPVKLTAVASASLHQQACSPRPRIPQQTLPDSRSSFSS
ncbi:hypothetical protein CDV31_016045 [Fusarium ambrosium]|uniref:Uncharacterized protein n=1 Tax=Fusarium ambrosium TaxID=131363 RepID=A0A428SFD3_9HYPO|nr:hypothetical protein CDV31_016045 [Fusarium ambrosium]